MTYIFCSIYSLRHCPYTEAFQNVLLRLPLNQAQHFIEGRGNAFRSIHIELMTEAGSEGGKELELLLIRYVVDPVRKWYWLILHSNL